MIPIPTFTNWLQVVAFVSVLIYMAYLRNLGVKEAQQIKLDLKAAATDTKGHLDAAAKIVAEKAEQVHDLVNGQNTEFKRLLTLKTDREIQAHQDIADHAAMKATDKLRDEFAAQIRDLQKIIASQQQTIQAGPTITQTPEQRLSEIRGEPK